MPFADFLGLPTATRGNTELAVIPAAAVRNDLRFMASPFVVKFSEWFKVSILRDIGLSKCIVNARHAAILFSN
jgi:hypothetical protein